MWFWIGCWAAAIAIWYFGFWYGRSVGRDEADYDRY